MFRSKCFSISEYLFMNKSSAHENVKIENSLSLFLAEVFTSRLQINLNNTYSNFLKTWVSYVDDIFAVVNKDFLTGSS